MLINLEGPPLKSLLCEMVEQLMLINLEGPPLKSLLCEMVEQLMLIDLEGPPLKSLLCEMGGATDADQPRGTTPEVFTL